jgi:hypothetical protein
MPSNAEYIPGVCNIGPAEIRMRYRAGWFGLGITILLWLALTFLGVPSIWKLTLFFPAMMSAIGFLQGIMHFCAAFGILGVFNFGPKVGNTDTVEQAEYRRKDQQKAILIIIYSILIGIAFAVLGYIL